MSDGSSSFDQLFTRIPVALHVYAIDRSEAAIVPRFVAANAAAERAFGPGTVGMPLEDAFPELAAAGIASLCERVARAAETSTLDETGLFGAIRLRAFRLDADQIGVVFEDRSDLEEAHAKQLRAERRLLQHTIDCAPAVMFVKAPDDTYLVVNKACATLVNAEPEYFHGKKNRDFFPADASAVFEAADKKIFAEGKAVVFEEQVPVKDREETLVSLTTKTPFYDDDGQPLFLVGVSQDITARKRAEEAAQRSHAELAETQSTLRQTIRDLTTPVLPIHDGVLVAPLVGHMDSVRSIQLMEALLAAIQGHRARVVIIDITGVELVDITVAEQLIRTSRAAALLGARSILVGIAPTVAQALVQVSVDFGAVHMCRDLQAGVALALQLTERS